MESHQQSNPTPSPWESDSAASPPLSALSPESDPTSSSLQSLEIISTHFHTANSGLPTDILSIPPSAPASHPHPDPSRPSCSDHPSGLTSMPSSLASPDPPRHPLTQTPSQTQNTASPASKSSDLSVHPHPPPQRLSVLRQGGTASVLDLASLVRSARDRAQQSSDFICSPPLYNYYYTSTSSFNFPPLRPGLSDSTQENLHSSNASLESKSLSLSHSSIQNHQIIPTLDRHVRAERESSPSSSAQLSSVDIASLAEPASTKTQQHPEPGLSSSLVGHDDEIESKKLRNPDPEAELEAKMMSSCLPISMDAMRSSTGPKKRKPHRSKSQSGGLHAFWALGPHEALPESSVDPCSSTQSNPPPLTRTRLRSLSGPSSNDPQHSPNTNAVPVRLFFSFPSSLRSCVCSLLALLHAGDPAVSFPAAAVRMMHVSSHI
ncbi:hypothetical protein PGTUg99_014956 [Puccinia graminis f. sp. tritici]|uniref:Uncharacterized protein n=1 Tax=Puccinia graminis f. sp. tritici TaxID=56615 RepID=A0A5B0SJ39_PUCGR|nr:hypothetical protein PGTUg99_014956 [Puccinia graminis f. sp. tritici]